jgi:hypothetical protein
MTPERVPLIGRTIHNHRIAPLTDAKEEGQIRSRPHLVLKVVKGKDEGYCYVMFDKDKGFLEIDDVRNQSKSSMADYTLDMQNLHTSADASMQGAVGIVARMIYAGELFAYQAVYIGCYIACFLQILVLMFIAFEPPGFAHPDPKVLRFISNNIAEHRGFGAGMVLCFAASLIPLCMCRLLNWFTDILIFLSLFIATLGGAWVIMFHESSDTSAIATLHVAGAGMLVFGGVLMHFCVCLELRTLRLHWWRDTLIFVVTLAAALGFLATIVTIKSSGWEVGDHPRWYWASAAFEYILYVSFVALNWLVPDNLVEHTALRVVVGLPGKVKDVNVWLPIDNTGTENFDKNL